jgi:hypothetical protein
MQTFLHGFFCRTDYGLHGCYFCPLCVRHLETARHLFFDSPFARLFWAAVAAWPHCAGLVPQVWSQHTNLTDTWGAMIQATAEDQRGGVQTMVILVAELWKKRNCCVFRDKASSLIRVVQLIREEAKVWAHIGAKGLRRIIWEPP